MTVPRGRSHFAGKRKRVRKKGCARFNVAQAQRLLRNFLPGLSRPPPLSTPTQLPKRHILQQLLQ